MADTGEFEEKLLKGMIPNSEEPGTVSLRSGETLRFETARKVNVGFEDYLAPQLGGDSREVPLVFYRGVQRITIGKAIVFSDGTIDAVLNDAGLVQFGQALRGREITQMSFGFSIPVIEEDVQFVAPEPTFRPGPHRAYPAHWSGWPSKTELTTKFEPVMSVDNPYTKVVNEDRPLPEDLALD